MQDSKVPRLLDEEQNPCAKVEWTYLFDAVSVLLSISQRACTSEARV